MKETIYLGADHAGFHLKESIREQLLVDGWHVEDLGAKELDPSDDFPVYAKAVASRVAEGNGMHPGSTLGVLVCGNAQGVCIAANKFDGIRAGIGYSTLAARGVREEDNANVICLPGRVELEEDPIAILKAFLEAEYRKEDRFQRRLGQIMDIERYN